MLILNMGLENLDQIVYEIIIWPSSWNIYIVKNFSDMLKHVTYTY
jgi:hypothetical protein